MLNIFRLVCVCVIRLFLPSLNVDSSHICDKVVNIIENMVTNMAATTGDTLEEVQENSHFLVSM